MMLRMFGLALALVALVGCRNPGDPLDQLQLFVSVEPAVVTATAPVAVTVRIVNTSDQATAVHANGCPQLFEVRTLSGALIGPEPTLCNLLGYPPVQLLPGAEWRLTYQWTGKGRGEGSWDVAALPPGAYHIQAVLYPLCNGCSNRRSEAATVVLE
jgi:hypothetical protein